MDDIDAKEMVATRIKNMKHQIYLLEKYFPWTYGPNEDDETQENEDLEQCTQSNGEF